MLSIGAWANDWGRWCLLLLLLWLAYETGTTFVVQKEMLRSDISRLDIVELPDGGDRKAIRITGVSNNSSLGVGYYYVVRDGDARVVHLILMPKPLTASAKVEVSISGLAPSDRVFLGSKRDQLWP